MFFPLSVLTRLHPVEVEYVESVLDGHPHVRHAESLQVLQLLREGLQVLLPASLSRDAWECGNVANAVIGGLHCVTIAERDVVG